MPENARHYFVYGNTAQGFVDKLTSNLAGIDTVYVLRGRFGAGRAHLMPALVAACEKTGLPLEYLHCPTSPEDCDGVIVPRLGLAVVDGTDVHAACGAAQLPSARVLDVDETFDEAGLEAAGPRCAAMASEAALRHEEAFEYFRQALTVHDGWEKVYISAMDFDKADRLSADTADRLLGGQRAGKKAAVRDRFFGASTPAGPMDFIKSLTGNLSRRYLLKGRPGTGKSTLLNKLAAAAVERGFDTERYFCALDSKSLDMLLWPELGMCIFDSTAPHVYEPELPGDTVIDMYAACVEPGTDERHAEALELFADAYARTIRSGIGRLHAAKATLDELTAHYARITDPQKLQRVCGAFEARLHSLGPAAAGGKA